MTRVFTATGEATPVTVLSVPQNEVVRQKTAAKDGYDATVVQAGKKIRESRRPDVACDLVLIENGTEVILKGVSKGKGFAGTIKRHGFKRGPAAHGSKNVRKPGSIGSGYPQHVMKGMKMGGHMGDANQTMRTTIVGVHADQGIILVKGSVPGSRGTMITLQTV